MHQQKDPVFDWLSTPENYQRHIVPNIIQLHSSNLISIVRNLLHTTHSSPYHLFAAVRLLKDKVACQGQTFLSLIEDQLLDQLSDIARHDSHLSDEYRGKTYFQSTEHDAPRIGASLVRLVLQSFLAWGKTSHQIHRRQCQLAAEGVNFPSTLIYYPSQSMERRDSWQSEVENVYQEIYEEVEQMEIHKKPSLDRLRICIDRLNRILLFAKVESAEDQRIQSTCRDTVKMFVNAELDPKSIPSFIRQHKVKGIKTYKQIVQIERNEYKGLMTDNSRLVIQPSKQIALHYKPLIDSQHQPSISPFHHFQWKNREEPSNDNKHFRIHGMGMSGTASVKIVREQRAHQQLHRQFTLGDQSNDLMLGIKPIPSPSKPPGYSFKLHARDKYLHSLTASSFAQFKRACLRNREVIYSGTELHVGITTVPLSCQSISCTLYLTNCATQTITAIRVSLIDFRLKSGLQPPQFHSLLPGEQGVLTINLLREDKQVGTTLLNIEFDLDQETEPQTLLIMLPITIIKFLNFYRPTKTKPTLLCSWKQDIKLDRKVVPNAAAMAKLLGGQGWQGCFVSRVVDEWQGGDEYILWVDERMIEVRGKQEWSCKMIAEQLKLSISC